MRVATLPEFDRQLSCTLKHFDESWWEFFETRAIISSQLSSTLMQLLFSFDRGTKVEKTLMQTLASQFSSTLMQLLFSFDRGTKVEKTLMQTVASQFSSTLMQLLFSFDRRTKVEKTLMQTLASQFSSTLVQLLFSFDRGMRVEKTLMRILASIIYTWILDLINVLIRNFVELMDTAQGQIDQILLEFGQEVCFALPGKLNWIRN
jgi:plasmid replication initiation protein